MDWNPIRKAGYVAESNMLPSEPGMAEAATFLCNVIEVMAGSCAVFYDAVQDLPFIYRERQIQSVLLPAITKAAKIALVELPITRGTRQRARTGWIDYWVYNEPFVYLIEAKHGWVSADSGDIRKPTRECWRKAQSQLNSISKAEAKALAFDPDQVLKMALLVAPCYQASKNNKDKLTPFDKTQAAEIHDRLVQGLSPTPNWSGVWLLHDRLQRAIFEYDHGYEIYPCVSIMANIKSLT